MSTGRTDFAPAVTERSAALRDGYLQTALSQIPRLLGSIDRNPLHATFGCFDRQFWHYRTAAFPSEMYQEGVLPLALVYALPLAGNPWYQQPRVRELAVAALRFSARNHHGDGSCDDYYPYERALGAAVFSLQACTRAYQLMKLDDAEIRHGLLRRGRWVADHTESGRLANHHALAALALVRLWKITGQAELLEAADRCIHRLLKWQSTEGWFEEYGGADPGYQTVTIDCLAKYQQITASGWLDEPLRQAVDFCGNFLHPDSSYAGEYGSRGTCHFYPHGFELLAARHAGAARLADAFLHALASGSVAAMDDDRLYVHRLANLLEAWIDWSPTCPATVKPSAARRAQLKYFRDAEIVVCTGGESTCQTIVSGARGGVFKHFADCRHVATDSGLMVETSDGRQATSQRHDLARATRLDEQRGGERIGWEYRVTGPLDWIRHETATPAKQALFHLGLITVGRWCRTLVRRLLQRRLITAPTPCPIRLTRTIQMVPHAETGQRLRVVDTIELLDRRLQVRRLAFASDAQTAYVAATNVHHPHALQSWTDLAPYVDALNRQRQVTIERAW